MFWQNVIVIALVAAAAAYLLTHCLGRRRRRAACANCPTLKVLSERERAKTKQPIVRLSD